MTKHRPIILEANEKLSKTSAFAVGAIQVFREEVRLINADRRLSEDAKSEDIQELRKRVEREILKQAKQMREDYEKPLKELVQQSQKTLAAALPTVDPTKQALFTKEVQNMRAKAIFALDQKSRLDTLQQLLSLADEPKLAEEAKPLFLELSQQILANTKDLNDTKEIEKVRYTLGRMFESLENTARVEGAEEAQQALESATSMLQATMFSDIARNALKEISDNTSRYINDPAAYFAKEAEKAGSNGAQA